MVVMSIYRSFLTSSINKFEFWSPIHCSKFFQSSASTDKQRLCHPLPLPDMSLYSDVRRKRKWEGQEASSPASKSRRDRDDSPDGERTDRADRDRDRDRDRQREHETSTREHGASRERDAHREREREHERDRDRDYDRHASRHANRRSPSPRDARNPAPSSASAPKLDPAAAAGPSPTPSFDTHTRSLQRDELTCVRSRRSSQNCRNPGEQRGHPPNHPPKLRPGTPSTPSSVFFSTPRHHRWARGSSAAAASTEWWPCPSSAPNDWCCRQER
jgi:hypothetical protein